MVVTGSMEWPISNMCFLCDKNCDVQLVNIQTGDIKLDGYTGRRKDGRTEEWTNKHIVAMG